MMMTRILRMMSIFDSDGPPHLRAITTYQARTGAAVVNIRVNTRVATTRCVVIRTAPLKVKHVKN
jgi:hypothetical protein